MNTLKDKLTTFHWCFLPNLISKKRWLNDFFNNFICFIINRDLYVITFRMHYTLFITVFRRNKLIAIIKWSFHVSGFLRSFMISFKYSLILWSYFSIDSVLYQSPLIHVQYISAPEIVYSFWFIIIFFFQLKKVPNISNYSVFNCFKFFFILKRFLILLTVLFSISFLTLIKIFTCYLFLFPLSDYFIFSESKVAFSAPLILFKLFAWPFCRLNWSILIMVWKKSNLKRI